MLRNGSRPHWMRDEGGLLCGLGYGGKKWTETAKVLPAYCRDGCQPQWRQRFKLKKKREKRWWDGQGCQVYSLLIRMEV